MTTGRSDPGLQVDRNSDRRLSAVISAPPGSLVSRGFQALTGIIAPSWGAAPNLPSPRNVLFVGSRSASPETVIALPDLNATTRQLVGWSDFEISRASEGNPNEAIDIALSKVIGEDGLGSFEQVSVLLTRPSMLRRKRFPRPNLSRRWPMQSRKSLTSLVIPSNMNKQFLLTT